MQPTRVAPGAWRIEPNIPKHMLWHIAQQKAPAANLPDPGDPIPNKQGLTILSIQCVLAPHEWGANCVSHSTGAKIAAWMLAHA